MNRIDGIRTRTIRDPKKKILSILLSCLNLFL